MSKKRLKKLNKRKQELLKEFELAENQVRTWTFKTHQIKGAHDEVARMIEENQKERSRKK